MQPELYVVIGVWIVVLGLVIWMAILRANCEARGILDILRDLINDDK